MHLKLLAFILFTMILLSGCSGVNQIYRGELGYDIEIKNISLGGKPNKSEYLFKKKLKELFAAQSNYNGGKFYLDVSVAKSVVNYGTQPNSVDTRSILKFTAEYNILDNYGKIVDSGSATVADSFEISASLYSAVITEEATSDRLALALASELRNIVNSKIIQYMHQSEYQR